MYYNHAVEKTFETFQLQSTRSPHFSSGVVERAKLKCVNITPREKSETRWGERKCDFHARSRFARSTIPEEKWGLLVVYFNYHE